MTKGKMSKNIHVLPVNGFPSENYDKIVRSSDLFWEKLRALPGLSNKTLKVPKLGGNTLDLHRLFIEVTSRGGVERVIMERRWKEVSAAFNFPTTVTNASFVLMKYYRKLLDEMEHVYYLPKPASLIESADESMKSVSPNPDEDNYHKIVRSSDLFWEKLRALPGLSNKTLKVPKIGGNFLDLHRLFIEVTSRGGVERVIMERRWKEVSGAFNFPTTVTNASFVLRKYYRKLLDEMEHVYYLPKPASSIESADESMKSLSPNPDEGIVQPSLKRSRLAEVDSQNSECYKSGYNVFFAEQYDRLKPEYHRKERAITKKIGNMWSNLSDSEKQVYQDKGLKDVEKYRMEMLEYESSHESGASSSASATGAQ